MALWLKISGNANDLLAIAKAKIDTRGNMKKQVEVIMREAEPMYFFGSFEIEKPKLLVKPVGDIVAFVEHGLGGKRFAFTAEQVASVKNMDVVGVPKWLV
ncbi:TPA: hypothetical protein ACJ51G_001137 [Aeromonas hydrophila subsp. hydrophila]